MEGFKKLSEVDPSIQKPKSGDKIILLSKLDKAGIVVDMVEEEDLKSYWKVVNMPNGELCKDVVDKELASLDRHGTWDVVDKVEGGKEVGSK
jgi:hypothetical protein